MKKTIKWQGVVMVLTVFVLFGTCGKAQAAIDISVSSDKADGTYTIGEVIDIDVTFSENVTSTGDVTVTLETGTIDRTCVFIVAGANMGTCNYTVQSGDTSADLTVSTIAGTINDASGNAIVNFVPTINLADNKTLVIDTTFTSFSIAIKTPPKKTLYNVGDKLDLSGLVVTLTSSNGNTQNVQDIEFMDFASNGITTSLADGTVLEGSETEVVIKFTGFSVSQEISFDPVWSCDSNSYSDSNGDSKENLVVIVHGMASSASDWRFTKMRDHIIKEVDTDKTTVRLFDWKEDAGGDPNSDYNNGPKNGKCLAQHISQYDIPPKNIHLIAHSVGSNVTQEAVKELATDLQKQDSSSHWDYYKGKNNPTYPFMHLTFLDAFAPYDAYGRYGSLYGFQGYAEQYVDEPVHDQLTRDGDKADFAYTNMLLSNATNFDITYLVATEEERVHQWPVYFYDKTITDPEYTLPVSDNKNYFNLGFLFARERISHVDPEIHNNKWCIVTNVSEPYRRCVEHSVEENRDAIITNQNDPVSIEIPSDSKDFGVDVSQLIASGTGVLPKITMVDYSNAFAVQIPDQTTIRSNNSGWDGVFMAPERASEYCPICNLDGNWKLNYSAIKIGLDDSKLSFNRGVRIFFPGEGGKNVGYGRDGEGFHEIINPCYDDSQGTGDALPVDGACKIDINNGIDLVVWTKHFTTFAAYELNDTNPPTTTISTSGTQGNDYWFTSDAQVMLSTTDNEDGSGIDKTEYSLDGGTTWLTYADSFTISNEGANEIKFRSIDKAGNVEVDQSSTINIDKTAPVITGTATPSANEKGWNNSDVKVDFTCEDVGTNQSGVDTNDVAGNTLTSEGAGQTVINTGDCVDKAGNKAVSVTISNINIDKTAPEADVSASLDDVAIDVDGTDNLSEVMVVQEDDKNYILTDQAGNITKLQFEGNNIRKVKYRGNDRIKRWYKNFSYWNRFFSWFKKETHPQANAKLKSIQYNNNPVIELTNNSLHFEWKTSRKELFTLTDQQLEVFGKFMIKGDYNEKKDVTKIFIHEGGRPKHETVEGLRILDMKTAEGILQYAY